jgi:hypothetical protein
LDLDRTIGILSDKDKLINQQKDEIGRVKAQLDQANMMVSITNINRRRVDCALYVFAWLDMLETIRPI